MSLSARAMRSLPSPDNVVLVMGLGAGKNTVYAAEGGTVQLGKSRPPRISRLGRVRVYTTVPPGATYSQAERILLTFVEEY